MINRISCEQAAKMLTEQDCQLLDIRDPQSYQNGHIPNSVHLSDANLDDFLLAAEPDMPTLVVCYHGNSSQGAAGFLMEKDFTQVYSVDGGFSQWRLLYPKEIELG